MTLTAWGTRTTALHPTGANSMRMKSTKGSEREMIEITIKVSDQDVEELIALSKRLVDAVDKLEELTTEEDAGTGVGD